MRVKTWSFAICAGLAASSGMTAEVFRADRDFFFDKCGTLTSFDLDKDRKTVVPGRRFPLTVDMRSAIGELFGQWEKHGDGSKPRLAFVLATARRESSGTFRPVREANSCGSNEACREAAILKLLTKRYPGKSVNNYAAADASGNRYYGRGYIQLTSKSSYLRAGEKLGIDLASKPDRALEPAVAGEILVKGMLEGWFGNRQPLSHYINDSSTDFINARNNVNPGSPHKLIVEAYAKEILGCLRSK